MPELPEVTTIVNDLNKHILGFTIKKVTVTKGYPKLADSKEFIKTVTTKKVVKVLRVAKNIVIELEGDTFIITHLAMTGRLILTADKDVLARWVKVLYELENKTTKEEKKLVFCDVRMFGKVVLATKKDIENLKQKYGPEPIQENLTLELFYEKLKSKKSSIKNVLLDQQIIAGLGNIYATDTLFLAGIHPETPTTDLTLEHALKLLESAKSVLNEGIKNRGSTLSDKMYIDIFGKEGSQQNFFKIYAKEVCPKCEGKAQILKINGRSTYFCPNCQPVICKSKS